MPYYVERDAYNDEDSYVCELASGNVAVIGRAIKYHDEGCESGVTFITLLHDNLSTEALKTVVAEDYYGTHCQHEGDCCGHTYCGEGRLLWNNEEIALISQSWHVNI